jgi:hypothetical protein
MRAVMATTIATTATAATARVINHLSVPDPARTISR